MQSASKFVCPRIAAAVDTKMSASRIASGIEAELPELPTGIVFRMTQQRRMRSDQMHHLDHPYLGVLVIVNELPDPLAAPEEG